MYKKLFLPVVLGFSGVISGYADVKVNLAPGAGLKEVSVSHATISDMLSAQPGQPPRTVSETYPVVDDSFMVVLSTDGAGRYSIDFSDSDHADFYAAPGEELTVTVSSLSPLTYTVSGSPLMDGMTLLDSRLTPIVEEFNSLRTQPQADPDHLNKLVGDYNAVLTDYIKANPANPAAVYALLELDGEDFLAAESLLQPEARASILYPFVEMRKPYIAERVEAERRQRGLADGSVDAFDFKLKNLEGKDVSLSDFRGKWVIIDFWGSWCIWCIKGFPHLKEVYEAEKDRLEVIGVDCQDSEQAWRDAVAKYALPWVNVYNPASDDSIEKKYGLQGFPTKVIVSPQGKIMDITTGEDPDFYRKLATLMGDRK